jgi:D-glycero-alpha-D-manno-heptose 1-phosphate guanylyltransferase
MREAILLAGGLGTRLQNEVNDLPKSMAMINGKPFLQYQLDYLSSFGITKVVLAIVYLHEIIIDYFGENYKEISIIYSHEKEPLGTGGAIKKALEKTSSNTVLILNGDTIFKLNINRFYESHINTKADFSLVLKPLRNFKRYGVVELNKESKVVGFEEKKQQKQGNINGGVYLINKAVFKALNFNNKFSFEKEFLEREYVNLYFNGFIADDYFLDIGVPQDYKQAQVDFKKQTPLNIDKTWTLFLDRDGVINQNRDHDYVKSVDEFKFLSGVKETIKRLGEVFGIVLIVTNQQCVGKQIISEEELNQIHEYLINEVKNEGGRIDKIYYAPQLKEENSIYRKPQTGMADIAKKDFSEIIFEKSIMVGDSLSDITFGNSKNMLTVLIASKPNSTANYTFKSLNEFYMHLFA